jgi:hypothetical protein
MSVFSTKVDGCKVTVVAANVAYVIDTNGKANIILNNGLTLPTDVGYDSVRRNVAKALSGAKPEAEAE